MTKNFSKAPPKRHERGVMLLFTLIVLVVLLMGGVVVVRSMNTSLVTAGNMAFKRDLRNQGEQAIANVLVAFSSSLLSSASSTANTLASANYSAVRLVTNDRGIPTVLLSNSASPSGLDMQGANFSPTAAAIDGTAGVSMRYVIDRLCNNSGTVSTLGRSGCVLMPSSTEVRGGTSSSTPRPDDRPPSLIYRLTVRVDGPRDTQTFIQTTFTKPD